MKASMSMMLLLLQLLYTNQLIVTVFEKGATYYYNEQDNQHFCRDDSQCDGNRICTYRKVCAGQARQVKSEEYLYDQLTTKSQCSKNSPIADYFCDGLRVCGEMGICEGTARIVKNQQYMVEEKEKCLNDWECRGTRRCNGFGICEEV